MDIKEPREDRRKDPIPGEYGFPIPKELFYRELGFGGFSAHHNFPRHVSGKKVISQSLATKAVHTLCTKELTRRKFKLPNGARTTFHIAFSADGTKVASCHGDHNVYVCDVSSGEVLQTLSGHPRTPWCVVFHPTQNDVLASGCLAGHVRVWDLKGGSELLATDSGTVIASLAFHPTVRLLAIATFNEIIFWDWGHPYPMARCSTENTKEKVRLVRFDRLGRSLITGITNFPSPPCKEEVRRPVRSGSTGSIFRPNILSRNFRSRRPSPAFPGSGGTRDEADPVEEMAMDNENEVVEEVVVPDPEVSAEAEAFAVAAAVAADEDPLIVGETLNARQDRFQESYRQLVSHYEELVSNYQQFLRSRIPRILDESNVLPSSQQSSPPEPIESEILAAQLNPEVEVNQMAESFESQSLSNSSSSSIPQAENESSEHITTLESPSSPVVMDDEVPGPSRLLLESNLMQELRGPASSIDASMADDGTEEPIASSAETSTTAPSGRSGGRSETDLRSIEALAQNILEMQNLCSQVRMDAPLAVENQHIVELRVIRRHLELLQEQTRELQSSIRATLNSLATGSLAALRSHVASATSSSHNPSDPRQAEPELTRFLNLEQAAPPTPVESGAPMDFESSSPPLSPSHRVNLMSDVPPSVSEPARRARVDTPLSSLSRSSGSPGPSGGGLNSQSTLYRIMIATPFSESSRLPNTPLFNRIRVPPMVAMQYEVPDPSRNQPGPGPARSFEESAVGSAGRESNSSNNGRRRDPSSNPGPRRIVREFHLVSGRPGTFVAEEHARHCPFSGRDPYHYRPPPRMRSLYDMGEMPPLITWPTMETGMETNIRNFREVTEPIVSSSIRPVRSVRPNITITVRNGLGVPLNISSQNESSRHNANRNEPFISFSEWLLSSGISMGNLTSDIFVGIYLTIRQLREGHAESSSSEQWHQMFGNSVPGLALIPPHFRPGPRPLYPAQTHRYPRRRRAHWICYNHNSSHSSAPYPMPRGSGGGMSSSNNSASSPDESTPSTSSNGRSQLPTPQPHASSSGSNNIPLDSSSRSVSPSASEPRHAARSSRRPIPHQLARNFTRVFYIRASDELIPVYSTVNSTENVLGTEVRESLQVNVYYMPIGLFLQGGPWDANATTIGIHWPPVTREEEYAILDHRMSDAPLNVYQSDTRESLSYNNRRYPRIRIDYDQTSLQVILPTGFSLHFIQSGLTLLDCISTSSSLPRPRPLEGTLWIDYLGPFLDALERMFGLRHTRRSLGSAPSHRVGAHMGRTPPWVYAGPPRPQASQGQGLPPGNNANPSDRRQSGGNSAGTSNDNASSNPGSGSRERPVFSSRRSGDSGDRDRPRRIITHAHDAQVDLNRRRLYEDNQMILSHGYMYDNNGSGFRSFLDRTGDNRRFYFRHRHRHDFVSNLNQIENQRDGADSGRFIRLAVDTAASEVLRRNHPSDGMESQNGLPVVEAGSASGFSTIGRPVESRIERVLNERGNRGAHSASPPVMMDESARSRMRLEEIQMRISMLSQWSRARAMATSGTQTPQRLARSPWSISAERQTSTSTSATPETITDRIRSARSELRQNLSVPGPSSTNGGSGSGGSELRITRRRPYSRIARIVHNDGDGDSDDEIIVSVPVPARIPRLNDQNEERDRRERSEATGSSRESGRLRHHIDHWVLRSVPPSATMNRYRPQLPMESSGSARTRAPPLNRGPTENAESNPAESADGETGRPRFSRMRGAASSSANGSNDGNNNNLGNGDDQNIEAGARFYPGYIPEILITPRTRAPTYYTMDAATTAFLSSRIQKWDFSEFLIPDITKRDEFVVVRECSLHSDACLDVSADSEFLAVLQPSDSGSYSSVGIYSLRDDSLGEILNIYHFDQNTVSVSISPSCDYLVVGYAGRGPLYRFVHPSRSIGKILSLTRDEQGFKLVPVKDLYADGQVAFMSINCMHWVPVAGYGIIYGTNTGDLVLLS